MKTFLTTLSMAAVLSVSVASTSAIAATPEMAVGCNTEYAACLKNGGNMSLKDSASNWASCNSALAACYKG